MSVPIGSARWRQPRLSLALTALSGLLCHPASAGSLAAFRGEELLENAEASLPSDGRQLEEVTLSGDGELKTLAGARLLQQREFLQLAESLQRRLAHLGALEARQGLQQDNDLLVEGPPRELAASPDTHASLGNSRLESLWNEKQLRKEFKKVSEAIDQLHSPATRAALYKRLQQKYNQAVFEGAIQPPEGGEAIDNIYSEEHEKADSDCQNQGRRRGGRRWTQRPQQTEDAAKQVTPGMRPGGRQEQEDVLLGEANNSDHEQQHSARPSHGSSSSSRRRRRRPAAAGQGFAGGAAADTSSESNLGEEVDSLQDTSEADEETGESGSDNAQASREASLVESETEEEIASAPLEEEEEQTPQQEDKTFEGDAPGTDQEADGDSIHTAEEAREAVLGEGKAREEVSSLLQEEEGTEQEEEGKEQEEGREQAPQEEAETVEESQQKEQQAETVPAELSADAPDGQNMQQASDPEKGAETLEKTFLLAEDEGEPKRHAAETQSHRQTQRAGQRKRHEDSPTVSEVQRRGQARRHPSDPQGPVERQSQRRGHTRKRESQAAERLPRHTHSRPGHVRRQDSQLPRQSGRQTQQGSRGVEAAGELSHSEAEEQNQQNQELLSFALQEASKLKQMASNLKHLHDYVVQQERLSGAADTAGRAASREALEAMIETDIGNLLESFRTLLSYASDVRQQEEEVERRWGAPVSLSVSSSAPQQAEHQDRREEARPAASAPASPPNQGGQRARSSGQVHPARNSSNARSRTPSSAGESRPAGRSSPSARPSQADRTISGDETDHRLTYRIIDSHTNSNNTRRTLSEVDSNHKEAKSEAEAAERRCSKPSEPAEEEPSASPPQADALIVGGATASDALIRGRQQLMEFLQIRQTVTGSEGDPQTGDKESTGNFFYRATEKQKEEEASKEGAKASTDAAGVELQEAVESKKHGMTASPTTENTSNASVQASGSVHLHGEEPSTSNAATDISDAFRQHLQGGQVFGDGLGSEYPSGEGPKELVATEQQERSSSLRNLAGIRKRTKFRQPNAVSSEEGEEEATEVVFEVAPFETSSSRAARAGPVEPWLGARSIRLGPRTSGRSVTSDGSDYPNTPYRTYRTYNNPFSSPYSTHSFMEDYGKRYSNRYYHEVFPRNAISWREFVRRREEKKALEKRKQEETNEPTVGVLSSGPPEALGLITMETRRSVTIPQAASQRYRPSTASRRVASSSRSLLTARWADAAV
ncbi:hypothetical protein Efla_005864 [Eimeria flavescens]